jgi:hypothetical protein
MDSEKEAREAVGVGVGIGIDTVYSMVNRRFANGSLLSVARLPLSCLQIHHKTVNISP